MDLPVSPKIHLEGLREGLKEMSAKLKEIYVDVFGSNPWDAT